MLNIAKSMLQSFRWRRQLEKNFDPSFYRSHAQAGEQGLGLRHYMRLGWREGRDPNDWFSTGYYLDANPDVARLGINPFLHYLKNGQFEGRRPSRDYISQSERNLVAPKFDAQFYTAEWGAEDDLDDPLEHFLTVGWRAGCDPNEWFSVPFYLGANPDVKRGDINPLVHYLLFGQCEGRATQPFFVEGGFKSQNFLDHQAAVMAPGPYFEEFDYNRDAETEPLAKAFAYYLPQFHEVPENDQFWGAGFTEWRNVKRGTPRFLDHVQPRVPRDLGYYDLDDPKVMQRQVDLAKAAGLFGWCFYYYRFGETRVLDKPLERLLADDTLDMPFTIMWANESWTRTWDGCEEEVLLQQEYAMEHDAGLVDDLARHFQDRRYFKIDGRPLFFIYRPGQIPNVAARMVRLRALFRERYQMEPLFFMAQGFGVNDPREFGLDGAIEFPPHKLAVDLPNINAETTMYDRKFSGNILRYDDVVARSGAEPVPEFPLIRTTVPQWDNEARRPGNGTVLQGSTPQKFEAWMRNVIAFAQSNPVLGETIVCVNAWNEWAEGAYLEPDVHYGAAYLNALSRALNSPSDTSKDSGT